MKRNLLVRAGAIAVALSVAFFSIVPDLVNAEGDAEPAAETEAVAEAPGEDVPAADVPETAPNEDMSAADVPAAPEGDAAGTTDTSVPDTPDTTVPDTSGDVAADGSETTEPDADTDVSNTETEMPDTEVEAPDTETEAPDTETETPDTETPDTEAPVTDGSTETEQPPVQEPAGEDTQTVPEETTPTEQTTPPAAEENPTEDNSAEMDSIEDYLKILADNRREISEELLNEGFADELKAEEVAEESDEGDFVIEGTTVVGYNGAGGYIAIPEGITAIGDNAFLGNTSITGVLFPSTLQIIGSSAFNGCSNLEAVNIPESVTAVGSSAFANCTGLAAAGIGANTGAVSQGEFYNCSSLTSVTVPEGISSVAFAAFGNCSNLSSVSLPSTLSSLDLGAFTGDVNLASISVASGSYSSYDGCVYTAGGGQLLLCPQGKTGISFASGMQTVGSGAFSGCNYLLAAVIPDATNTIEANAFSGSAIKAVTIPAGVTSIGTQSGWSPSVIYGYSGTAAERWANTNGYVFESLNGSQGGGEEETEDPEHIEDTDPTNEKPGSNGGEGGNGGDGVNTKPQTGNNQPNVYAASPAATAAVSQNVSSYVKDATPKTGVNDNRIFFLFGAFLLMGIACFTFSRKMLLDGKKKI